MYMKVILLNEKTKFLFFFFISLFFNSFIYLVIFGCTVSLLLWGFSPVVASEDYSLVVEHGFLIAVASLVADHEL